MYKTCMVSKTPLIKGETVRVLLLASTGNYNNYNSDILTIQPVCAWSGFQVVGGLSAKGSVGSNGVIVFEKDIIYDYLNLKMSDFAGKEVKLEDFPVKLSNDNLKNPYAKIPNFFISMAYVKEDIYKDLVKAYKEYVEGLNEVFYRLLEGRDNILEEDNPDDNAKLNADIYLSDLFNGCIGYACHLYNSNVFSALKTLKEELSDRDIFELLQPDNIFFEALDKNGVMLCPTPLSGVYEGFNEERMSYYKGVLLSYLNTNNHFYDCVKAKQHVKIFHEVKIKDIESFFEGEIYIKERESIHKMKSEFAGQSKVIIERKNFKNYPFLKRCLVEQPGDVIIVF